MLGEKQINELKKVLIEKLESYNGEEKIKFDIAPTTLEKLIFKEKMYRKQPYKVFDDSLIDLCKKMDLSWISFDGFNAEQFDFSD